MSRTMFKLRIAGIAFFLLFFLSAIINFHPKSSYYFDQIQQILIFVSFVIFGLLILLQGYAFYMNNFGKDREEEV